MINCQNNGSIISFSTNAIVELAPKLDIINNLYEYEVGGRYLNSNYLENSDLKLIQNGSDFYVSTSDESVTYKLVLNVGTITWNQKHEDGTNVVSNGVKMILPISVNNDITNSINSFYAYDLETALEKNILKPEETANLRYQSSSGYQFAVIVKDNRNYLIFAPSTEYSIDSSVLVLVYSYDMAGHLKGILKYNN